MVVTPHARLSARDLLPFGDVVPPVRAVIDRMEKQSLMIFASTQVGFIQKRTRHRQTCLPIAFAILSLPFFREVVTESQQPLGTNGRGGAVYRLVRIPGISLFPGVVTQLSDSRSTGIPVGDSIQRGVADIEITDCTRRLHHEIDDRLTSDRKSTRLNSSHVAISYAVFCLKKKTNLMYDMHT